MPAITALIAPEMTEAEDQLEPVIGVTRYPSCSPRALSSMKMMPPPIITIMKIDMTIVPGQQVLDVRDVGIDLDDVELACDGDARRAGLVGSLYASTMPDMLAASALVDEVVGVVLDERDVRVVLGQHPPREPGRDVSTPLSRPLRRSRDRGRRDRSS